MDNVAFLGNLTRESDLYPSQPGFHFVGWPQGEQSEIQLIFKFDTTRRFTWIRLFTFDSLILRVRLFSHALVAFSMNGSTFSDNVEFSTGRVQYYNPQLTTLSRFRREPIVKRSKQRKLSSSSPQDPRIYADPEYGGAVVVELALGERIGRYVRLTLTAADIWTVLSEVQFNSTVTKPPPVTDTLIVPVVEKAVDVDLTPGITHSANGKDEQETRQDVQSSPFKSDKIPLGSTPNDANRKQGTHDVHPSGGKPIVNDAEGKLVTLLPIVIALGVLLFLLPVVVLIWLCSRRHFKRKQFKCRQKIHLNDGSTRTILRSVATSNMHEGAQLLGNSQSEGKSTLAPQLCFPNGIHPSNVFQRQNDPTLNGSVATNNVLHSMSGNPGVVLSGPTSVAPDKFESNADATQLCSPADGGYMTGVGSPLPNQTNIHPPLIPTLIAIPTTTPTGQIVLRPIGYGHSTTELSALASLGGEFITGGSLGGLGTPDSGSLYASIRASAVQLGQSTLSGGDSEAYDKTGSAFLPPPLPMRHLGRDEGVQWRGEDTDEGETDLRENGTAASRAKEPENMQHTTVSQCFAANSNNIHTEETEQEKDNSESVGNSNAKTTAKPTDMKLASSIPSAVSASPKPQEGTTFANEALFSQMKRTKLRPVSQRVSSALISGHRHSGLSLPDGEEAYTPYLSATVRRPGSKVHVPVKALHGTPAGLVLRPYGTGTLRPLSKHATPNSNHRLQTTVSQHPAGLMFLGGIGFEDMDALYQAVQPNVFSYPPEMGRPCNIYQPDQLVPAQQSQNGNLNLSETHEAWLLANSKQLNPLCSETGPQKSAWLTDVRGGTLRLYPTPVQQFPLGHTSTRVNDLSQITPQVSPQHYFPPQLILQHPNQHPQQQQQFRSMAVQPSNSMKLQNGDTHAQADVHRGSPVGAASASVAYLPGVSDSTSRETNHSGRLSIYSVCT
ncbi:DNA damage responsive protein, variant 2 [Clonorchis sinensis]|uniref:DNA damage responsive protein, variant 2 n=1 Tax=Clonorchis sinensis TaxID=79923 RepID=A0A8T1MN15_CLOSI|nr:DNA damage responsive protein, variant 2 [Clonorchis sinensis]